MAKTKLNKNKIIFNIIFLTIITGLTIIYLLKNNIFSSLYELKSVTWYNMLTLVLLICLYVCADCFIIYSSFKNVNKNMNFSRSVGAYFYGNLGSSITPIKLGHFPMKLFYYEKNGVSVDESLTSITRCQLIYSFVLMNLYFFVFLYCHLNHLILTINGSVIELKYCALLGVGINLFFAIVVLLMSFCSSIRKVIVEIMAFFMFKFHRIKDKEIYIQEQNLKMDCYRDQIIYFCKHFYQMILPVLSYFIFSLAFYGLPYFIYLFVARESFSIITYFQFFSMTQTMTYITNIIPVPGGTGVKEYVFLTVFKYIIESTSVLNATMIIWRFLTYYLLIIVDFLYVFISTILDKKKTNKKFNENEQNNEI